MSNRPLQVLIIGAGPVGLFAALCLARRGISVRVIDQSERTKRDPRAAVIWPRAAEALRAEGLAEVFRAQSSLLRSADLHVRGRLRGTVQLGALASPEPLPWIIEQHDTERLLQESLRSHGVEVEWCCAAEQVENCDGQVVTRLPNGASIQSQWAIGCDGSRSRVRKSLGIAFEGAAREHIECIQADAVPSWSHDRLDGHCRFFLEDEGTLLAVPLPTEGYRFVSFIRTNAPRSEVPVTLEEVRSLYARLSHEPALSLRLTEPVWLSRARFQDRVAATLRQGRILLAGDAAHVWTPIGGRGMNVGLLGAHNLAWKLARVLEGYAPDSLLDTYSQEQRAVARRSIAGLWMNRTEYPSNPWMLELVDSAMPLAAGFAPLWGLIENDLSGLPMHYRSSPLSQGGLSLTGVRSGNRLPYVAVEASEASSFNTAPLMSHALIDRRRWTLFQVGLSPESMKATREVIGGQVVYRSIRGGGKLGKGERLILVRPDSHVACVVRASETQQLGKFLATQWPARA